VRQLVAGVLGTIYLRAAADLNTEQAELEAQIRSLQGQSVNEADTALGSLKDRYKALTAQMSELRGRARALRGAKRNANVLTFVQSEMGITADVWDSNPWLLAVPNGVLDLRSGVCRAGTPADYLRTVAPTEWTGLDAPCPRFEQFLQEIFEGRPDRDALIAFLQRLLGYAITGLTTQHIFPILYGEEGRNGKDTLLATLKAVLGSLVGAVSNDVFIAQDKLRSAGAATPHLCDLQGKRLVWGSETKQGDRLNIAQIKQLTGGGDIPARQLHGHQYSFTPTHKLVLMTNYKPHADARDKAFWARACLIEFSIRYVEHPQAPNERLPDPTLRDTLKHEKSGILAWLVRGCLQWQQL
jgi:putative DNA primase/helicase